jgi:hypothetical protein
VVPLGTLLGAPLVTVIGGRNTVLTCAIATLALGGIAAGLVAITANRTATKRPTTQPTTAPNSDAD